MRKFFNLVAAAMVCSTAFFAISCEDDLTNIGSDMIGSGSTSNVYHLDLVSYNSNNDSIRSDAKVLQSGVLGVYDEPVFGMTKAVFYSQARLNSVNPDFGKNPEMDSARLYIPVYYKGGEEDIKIDTTYLYLGENEEPTDTATVRLKRTYKLDSIYGRNDATMTLQVREVAKYMLSQDSIYYSNPDLAPCAGCDNYNNIEVLPEILGETQISKEVVTYQTIKLNDDTTLPPVPRIEVPLNKDFFKSRFIDNQDSPDLNDQASFIRNFFRGIQLRVVENQGFLMNFNPHDPAFLLAMYYSYDNPTEQGEDEDDEDYKPRLNSNRTLTFTGYWASNRGYNVQVNQFEHAHRSNAFVNAYTNPNTVEGDARLYLDGMDGTKTVIKLNQDALQSIRDSVNMANWAIVGAELNFHVDEEYDFPKPPFLMAWNQYSKNGKLKEENFIDVNSFVNFYPNSVQFNPRYNYKDNPKMYTIRITGYLKEMVEKDKIYEDNKIIVSLGNFLMSPLTNYSDIINRTNPYYNNRAFNPYRLVLHGSNSEQESKQLRLKVYYTKK